MKKIPKGWKLSIRDGGNRFYDSPSRELTEEIKASMKKGIIQNHKELGLRESLKYELYPELFG